MPRNQVERQFCPAAKAFGAWNQPIPSSQPRDTTPFRNSRLVRGDMAAITIGQRTNAQDGCIVHVDKEFPVRIGDDVSLGHGAIVHGAIIEDNVLVGIRAVVLNGARVGKNSIIGAGAVVTPGMVVPPGSVVMGIPGRCCAWWTKRAWP